MWADGVSTVYSNGYFQIPGCFFCDDVFAECADVVFMDAWLPEYIDDPKGTSIIIVRNPEIAELIPGDANLEEIDIERVIYSQRAALRRKRSPPLGIAAPKKRIFTKKPFVLDQMIEAQRWKISIISGKIWDGDINTLERAISSYRNSIQKILFSRKILSLPLRSTLRLLSVIKRFI